MIHVPDVRATAAWYETIGFIVTETHEDEGEMTWAELSFGDTAIMLNAGGRPSAERRREVDLYVQTEAVDELYPRLKDRAEIVEHLRETHYGMREFTIRDINRFWITFGRPL